MRSLAVGPGLILAAMATDERPGRDASTAAAAVQVLCVLEREPPLLYSVCASHAGTIKRPFPPQPPPLTATEGTAAEATTHGGVSEECT